MLEKFHPYRPLLWILALLGLLGINGIFLYYVAFEPAAMMAALENPVSLVFIVEAFVMTAFLAWLISSVGLEDPGWGWFVILSLVGGLAFSAPLFILLHLRKREAWRRR
jgi:hypothetical protein